MIEVSKRLKSSTVVRKGIKQQIVCYFICHIHEIKVFEGWVSWGFAEGWSTDSKYDFDET